MHALLAFVAASFLHAAPADPPELVRELLFERELFGLREVRLSSRGVLGVCALTYLSLEQADGTPLACLAELHALVRNPVDLDFSPDGSRVVVAGLKGPVVVQELDPPRVVATIAAEKVSHAWFGPDGTSVIVVHDSDEWQSVAQYELPSGERLRAYGKETQRAFASGSGSTLATVGPDRSVRVWDLRTGEQLFQVAEKRSFGEFSGCALSPDGARLALAGSNGISVWEVASRKKIESWWKGEGEFPELAFAAGGGELYAVCTASGRKGKHLPAVSLRVLRLSDGAELARSALEKEPWRLHLAEDGSVICVDGEMMKKKGSATRWRLPTQGE